jgi:hypothetical protein
MPLHAFSFLCFYWYLSLQLSFLLRSIIRETNKTKGAYCSLVLLRKTTSLIEDLNSEALDCFPKGNHGPPKGDNQALCACMLVVVFTQ